MGCIAHTWDGTDHFKQRNMKNTEFLLNFRLKILLIFLDFSIDFSIDFSKIALIEKSIDF